MSLSGPARFCLTTALPGNVGVAKEIADAIDNSTNGVSTSQTITGTSATLLAAGPNGATTPSLVVDASTASAVTGIKVKSAAVGAGVAISVVSTVGGTNESATIDAKGSGTINLQSVATGAVIFGNGEAGTPAAQTVRAPAAAGSNVAGATLTVAGSQSTGTGLGGSVVVQVANLGSTGTTANTMGSVLTLAPPNTGTTAVVDGLTITGAITTGTVAVAATGTDAAIPLSIDAKGTGFLQLQSVSTGPVVFGQGELGTPAVQTIRAPKATGTNIAGANLTIAGSQSTGTGLGGSVIFQVANLTSTGTTANTMGSVLTLAPPNSGTTAVVNGLTVTGSITTAAVAVAATGSDAAIGLNVNAKGTGQVIIGGTSTGLVSVGRGVLSTLLESSTKNSVATASPTITVAQLLNGYYIHTTANGTVTFDSGSNIDTGIPGAVVGDCFSFLYFNNSGGTDTWAAGSGNAIKGNATIGNGKTALIFVTKTNTAAYDIVIVTSA
jgi:hypothetical protein